MENAVGRPAKVKPPVPVPCADDIALLIREFEQAKADIRAVAAYLADRDQLRNSSDPMLKRIAHLAGGD